MVELTGSRPIALLTSYNSYADKVARRGVPAWMLYTGEKHAEEGGVGEWERRLRQLEKGYRRLFGDEALAGYDVEEEVRRFKVWATWFIRCVSYLTFHLICDLFRVTVRSYAHTSHPQRRFSPTIPPRILRTRIKFL